MTMLTSTEKATLSHLAKSGDLHSQAWVDHEAELVNLRLGREGYVVVAKFATTGTLNLATTGLSAIDGVTPAAGDIALVKDQTSAIQNGLYVVSTSAWTRLKDVNGNDVLKTGVIVSVSQGTTNLDTLWTLTTNAGFIVGTNNVTFAQYVVAGVSAVTFASTANGDGASLIGIEDAGTLLAATTVEGALQELATDADAHLVDAVGAHAASAIVNTPAGTIAAIEVQAAINELDGDVQGHLTDAADAHDASAISVLDTDNLLAAIEVEAALLELVKYVPIALTDPGTGTAVGVTRSATVNLTIGSAGAETNTLAIPTFMGQKLIINVDTVGTGTRAITAAQAINKNADTVMTFAAARDSIVLEAVTVGAALRWLVTGNDGVTLS